MDTDLAISARNTALSSRFLMAVSLLLILACPYNASAQTVTGRDTEVDPSVPPGSAAEISLAHRQAVLGELKDKLAGFTLSANQDFDFAAFMQLYNETATKMAREEIGHGADEQLKELAKKHVASREKDQRQLERWVERFQKFN
jgi:uncharacterized protein (DUF305 family)